MVPLFLATDSGDLVGISLAIKVTIGRDRISVAGETYKESFPRSARNIRALGLWSSGVTSLEGIEHEVIPARSER